MDTPQNIPLTDINTTAFPRDRTLIDAAALQELQSSIAQSGLRLPIEVYQTDRGFALISGYRRLMAFQSLAEHSPKYSEIPAFIRPPCDPKTALAAMVEENEVRQNLSPWERARIAVSTTDQGRFETLDAALTTLFPHISRQKRAKLRAITDVVQALDGQLIDPELLSENQLMRLANALRHDWAEIIVTAIDEQKDPSSAGQWHRIQPIVQEVEALVTQNRSTNPNRPRRTSRPYKGIAVRRERTRYGYVLHITGRQATSALMTSVLDEIERWLAGD